MDIPNLDDLEALVIGFLARKRREGGGDVPGPNSSSTSPISEALDFKENNEECLSLPFPQI